MTAIGPLAPSQGLNTSASNFTITQNQATVLTNAYPYQGNIINTGGVLKLNSSVLTGSPVVAGVGSWIDPAQFLATNSPLIVVVAGTSASAKKIYSGLLTAGYGSITFTDVTGAVTLANQVDQRWAFGSLNGIFVGTGQSRNSDVPFQITTYNGNAANLSGTPPGADALVVVNSFMFLGRNLSASSVYSRVYWSNVGDPQTWAAANFVDFRKNDGDMITALSNIGTDLIIFKGRSIGRLSTTTTATSGAVGVTSLGPLVTISDQIGCACPTAVDKLPDGRLIFMDSVGHVRIFDGYSFTDVSDQALPGPSIQSDLNTSSYSNVGNSIVHVKTYSWKNQVYVNFSDTGGSSINRTYIYNYVENTWARQNVAQQVISAIYPSAFCVATSTQNASDTIPQHLLVGTINGFLYHLDNTTGPIDVGGTNQSGTVTVSYLLPEGFIPRCVLIPATIQSGGSLTVTLGFNGTMNGSPSTIISTTNAALWNLVDVRQIQTSLPRPLTIQIQISVTAGKTFTLYPMWLSDQVLSNVS